MTTPLPERPTRSQRRWPGGPSPGMKRSDDGGGASPRVAGLAGDICSTRLVRKEVAVATARTVTTAAVTHPFRGRRSTPSSVRDPGGLFGPSDQEQPLVVPQPLHTKQAPARCMTTPQT